MHRQTSLLLLLAAPLLAQPLLAQPQYQAARTSGEIVVDGRLSEFTWSLAAQVGRFQFIRPHPGTPQLATQAMLAWDDRNLYVAFVCADPQPWGTMMERDQHLWDEEVVELFLDPDGDGRDYPELEVSPHNVVVDLLIPAPGEISADEAANWDIAGLQTAVGKDAAGWTAEMSIPWKSLAESGVDQAPAIGDKWRVGLYRIERPGGAAPDRDGSQDQFQAWAPTEKSFHEPHRFGTVEFVLQPN